MSGQQHYYRLLRDTRYQIQAYYRFPGHAADSIPVLVSHPETVSSLTQGGFAVSSRNCTEYFDFKIKRYIEDRDGALAITAPDADSQTSKVVLPTVAMPFRVRESRLFWPMTGVFLMSYSLLGLLNGTDFGKLLVPLEAAPSLSTFQEFQKTLLEYAQANWLVVKSIASVLQAGVLFLLFRMMGKKVV